MENHGNFWSPDEDNRLIALLAQTKMSSSDCDIIFSNMFGRSPQAIYLRRIHIAKRLIKQGHSLAYLSTLLHLPEIDILSHIRISPH